MEQTKVEAALKKLWKAYIEVKMDLSLEYGTEEIVEDIIKRIDEKKTDEIVEYVEKEVSIR